MLEPKRLSDRAFAIELLQAARNLLSLSYRELAKLVGIPESVLCRYVNGYVIPSKEHASKIISALSTIVNTKTYVEKKIRLREEGIIDLKQVLYDPVFLKLYARRVKKIFSRSPPSKILTAAVDGIPLAVTASLALGKPFVVAKRDRDPSIDEYYEATIVGKEPFTSFMLYVPRSFLQVNETVLIVDDIAQSGKTLDALLSILEKAKCRLRGISILVAIGNAWRKVLEKRETILDKEFYVDIILQL